MMTDGTIMVADNCSALWYSYAPDINGNYANGTWTQKAAPSYAPLYFASAVLTDGKLIINGGEYDQCVGKETTKARSTIPSLIRGERQSAERLEPDR